VIALMALVKDARPQLVPSFISLAIVLGAAWWRARRSTRAETGRAGGRRRVPAT